MRLWYFNPEYRVFLYYMIIHKINDSFTFKCVYVNMQIAWNNIDNIAVL